jgi:3-hydroxyisobutyrate dehydrogenase
LRYGFIGLGNLGKHLAINLVRGGFDVTVHDLSRGAADEVLTAGAHWADSVTALAGTCDCLITCLPSPAATTAVLNQALPAMRRGGTWIEMSTNDFEEVEILAARARDLGIATLACPVTGGVHRAQAGDITVLVGGEQSVFSLHEPALKAMGGRVILLGGI